MKMQIACLLSLLFASAFVVEGRTSRHRRDEGGRHLMKECAEENGLTKEDMKDLFGKIREGDNDALKQMGCVNACVMEKKGTLVGNEIDVEKLKEMMDKRLGDDPEKAELMEKLDGCIEEVQGVSEKCELAGKFFHCAHSIWHRRRPE